MILAAEKWTSNADLIADCAELGYLRSDWLTLDPTYGRGNWWKKWRPDQLVTHDLKLDGVDFRRLPELDNTFDAITFDPPYVAPGGRRTSSVSDFNDRFGLHSTPATPALLQVLINEGLAEMHRVLKPKGFLLVKCKDYINGGRLFMGTHKTLTHALELGFECVDRLEHLAGTGPQPPNRRQVHARRNFSTLFVLSKGTRWHS